MLLLRRPWPAGPLGRPAPLAGGEAARRRRLSPRERVRVRERGREREREETCEEEEEEEKEEKKKKEKKRRRVAAVAPAGGARWWRAGLWGSAAPRRRLAGAASMGQATPGVARERGLEGGRERVVREREEREKLERESVRVRERIDGRRERGGNFKEEERR